MSKRLALLPLLLTSSLFLVHCSSGDDDSGGHSGSAGAGGSTSGSAGTGGATSGSAGATSMAGKPGTGGTSIGGSAGASSGAGRGGAGGAAAGQGGNGSVAMAGRAGGSTAGSAGASAGSAGRGSAGTGGMSGSAGVGTSGMGGAIGAGAGGTGVGGSGSGAFSLTSSVVTEGGMFPDMNTCASTSDSSPDLTWTAGPSGTLSYALILLDTTNSLNHWVIWDIPTTVTSLPAMLDGSAMLSMPAGAKQKAIQGNGYYGPCPNGADHVYEFTVYALPVAALSGAMTSSQTSQLAMAVMNAAPLASASLSAHSAAKSSN